MQGGVPEALQDFLAQKGQPSAEELDEKFDRLDEDHDGVLTVDELRPMAEGICRNMNDIEESEGIKGSESRATPKERAISEIIVFFFPDQSRTLSRAEFTKKLLSGVRLAAGRRAGFEGDWGILFEGMQMQRNSASATQKNRGVTRDARLNTVFGV